MQKILDQLKEKKDVACIVACVDKNGQMLFTKSNCSLAHLAMLKMLVDVNCEEVMKSGLRKDVVANDKREETLKKNPFEIKRR